MLLFPGAGVNPEMVPEVQSGMLAPPFMDHRMTGLTGPEDGAGGARRDACATFHGPLDDIGVGPHEANYRTHARHGVEHCSSGNGLR